MIDFIGIDYGFDMEDIGPFCMFGDLNKKDKKELFEIFKSGCLEFGQLSEDEFDLLPYRLFLLQGHYFGYCI